MLSTTTRAALSAAAALSVLGCGNDKAAAGLDDNDRAAQASLAMNSGAGLSRVDADMASREAASSAPAAAPQSARQPAGPLFYPPEWVSEDTNALQAAAIWFYQNPAAIDEPHNARMLVALYNCAEVDSTLTNEVRLANLAAQARTKLRAWLASARPEATFTIPTRLGEYDVAGGAFRWQGAGAGPILNFSQFRTAYSMACGWSTMNTPVVHLTTPYPIRTPAFTPAQAEAFIASNPGRQVDVIVHASVPRTSRFDNGPIARAETRLAITPTSVAVEPSPR